MSRDKPRHMTMFPGGESLLRGEIATQSGDLNEIGFARFRKEVVEQSSLYLGQRNQRRYAVYYGHPEDPPTEHKTPR